MDSAGCVSQIDRQPCRPCKGPRTGVPAVDRRKNLAVFHTRTPGSFCIRVYHRLSAAQSEIPPQPSRRACRIRPTRVRFVKRRFRVCALSSFCKDGNAESSRFASPRPRPGFPRPVRFVIPRHRPSAKHPAPGLSQPGLRRRRATPGQSEASPPGLSQPKLRRRRMTSGPH